jgi:hypothetical protein
MKRKAAARRKKPGRPSPARSAPPAPDPAAKDRIAVEVIQLLFGVFVSIVFPAPARELPAVNPPGTFDAEFEVIE